MRPSDPLRLRRTRPSHLVLVEDFEGPSKAEVWKRLGRKPLPQKTPLTWRQWLRGIWERPA